MPIQPQFENSKFMQLAKLTIPARYIQFAQKIVFILSEDCSMASLTFPRWRKSDPEMRAIGSIAKFLTIPPDEPISKSFVVLDDIGKFVVSSLWDNSFHVFDIDYSFVTHSVSVRQKFSLLSTLNSAGDSFLLASWRDSSLTLWNLADGQVRKPLYRKAPHLTSVVDVHANAALGLIASLDKGRHCILSILNSGAFQRSFDIEGTDSLRRLMLFSGGYVAVLSQTEIGDAIVTTVRIYGVNTRKIEEVTFEESVVEWCMAEFETFVSAVAITFLSKRVVILGIPDGQILSDWQFGEVAVNVTFSARMNCFILGMKNGDLSALWLD
jgi:WD40 repeat protein